eukprot:CAMPEP_0184484878 /NCGR_PEP_ID=MMETSP0113_2-20130426/6544_1 /TAXON_ID=91329 /ORGANISM="Norrisiella sphaerica, Strain BC52" /LENGTH=487 /DNA_ID=CAMNT_0026866063 /DNA_START=498 /DNA_END=1961 /DNA_ORIENTATION=+
MTSPGIDPVVGSVSLQNCHPFKWKVFTFMHNGGIQDFSRIKRKLQNLLCDEFYAIIAGSTDSENLFALFLSTLKRNLSHSPSTAHVSECPMAKEKKRMTRNGCNAKDTEAKTKRSKTHMFLPKKNGNCGVGARSVSAKEICEATPKQIATALHDTVQIIVDLMMEYSKESACSLNLAVTNGTTIIATRFRKGKSEPPSLYFAMLKEIKGVNGKAKIWANNTGIHPGVKELRADCVIVSSEPLTMDPCWNLVAESTMIIIHGEENNRSVAGKIELIPMVIRKCNRTSPRGYTCRPIGSRKRTVKDIGQTMETSRQMQEKEARTEKVALEEGEEDRGERGHRRNPMPPLMLTPIAANTMKPSKSKNRLEELREANMEQRLTSGHTTKTGECLLRWRNYIEPSLLVAFVVMLQKRKLNKLIGKYPRLVLVAASVSAILLVRKRNGFECPLSRFLFGSSKSGALKREDAFSVYRKQLRSDLMWFLLLIASR